MEKTPYKEKELKRLKKYIVVKIKKLFDAFKPSKKEPSKGISYKKRLDEPIKKINVDDDFSVIKQAFLDLNIDITDMSVKEIENELDRRIMNNVSRSLQQSKNKESDEATNKFFSINENHNLVILKAHVVSLKWWFDNSDCV